MHVPPNLYDAVARGEAPRELLEEIEREHFAALCPVCSDSVLGHEARRRRPGAWNLVAPGDALERLRRRLDLTEMEFQVEFKKARRWVKLACAMKPAERREKVFGAYSRYEGPIFCLLLLEEARKRMPAEPVQALTLADAVLGSLKKTAVYLPDPEYQAPALAVRGNAHRALGRLRDAEADLLEALRLLDSPRVTEPATPAEVYSYLGSLRLDQGRLEEAAYHLDRAAALYRLLYDEEKTARVLLKLGAVHCLGRDLAAAVAVTEAAVALLGTGSQDWLRGYAHYNLAHNLHAAGETERAEAELQAHAELIEAGGEHLAMLQVWLRARIAWSREELGRAERLFGAARRRALARGVLFEASQICLEHAVVQLAQGRTSRVKKLASEAIRLLAGQEEVDREIRTALALVEEALRREALTRELLERAIAALERARHARPAARGTEPA